MIMNIYVYYHHILTTTYVGYRSIQIIRHNHIYNYTATPISVKAIEDQVYNDYDMQFKGYWTLST